MAKTAKIAWGIDIGNCALKAMKVAVSGDEIELLDFAVIEHEKILSQPDITEQERNELTSKALELFLDDHDITKCNIVVSVPGQSSFARFVKLPPVEAKRIPELVRYEAIQQIPFEIDDVEWDWQIFHDDDSSDLEVGIFAIKNDLVTKALQPFAESKTMIHMVQMAPMALFNFFQHDQRELHEEAGSEAIITLDIGAENTDLVIADGIRVWQRSIPIGGNQFTAAVKKAFKLSFTKAETIKRSANTSKHARQIFQAMRPVFADLAAEIQRSLGFYSSSNREVQYREVIAMGSAMKLPGLVKFLQQSLSLPVKRLNGFETLEISPEISMTDFTAHLPSLSVAYGLAIQGVGQGAITSNLLPREIVRQTQWKKKKIVVIAACVMFVLAGGLSYLSALSGKGAVEEAGESITIVKSASRAIKKQRSKKSDLESKIKESTKKRDEIMTFYGSRDIPLLLFQAVHQCIPNATNNPSMKALYNAYDKGDRSAVLATKRGDRQQVFITNLDLIYTDDLSKSFDQIIKENEGLSGAKRNVGSMAGSYSGGGLGQSNSTAAAEEKKPTAGFVVMVAGYTPHKKGRSFLSPPEDEVGLVRAKWGMYNRLRYLGKTGKQINKEKIAEAKKNKLKAPSYKSPKPGLQAKLQKSGDAIAQALPFETYIDEGDLRLYFDDTKNGLITLQGTANSDQPQNLGIPHKEEVKRTKTETEGRGFGGSTMGMRGSAARGGRTSENLAELLDPFTMETISQCNVKDKDGEIILDESGNPVIQKNDTWFRVNFKVKLK